MDRHLIRLGVAVAIVGVAVGIASTGADLALSGGDLRLSTVFGAVGLGTLLWVLRDLSPKNHPFYKHGQAATTRVSAALLALAAVVYAAWSLYQFLDFRPEEVYRVLYVFARPRAHVSGVDMEISWRLFAALALFAFGSYGVYYSSNHPMVSDFLIETEGEMKKVSWPTRAEVVGSSVVVIATVMVLGVYMYIVDFGLDRLRAVLRGVLS